jgi:hypothetical protein
MENELSISNKNSPWAHMELGFDMLDVARKLVNYIIFCPKNKIEKQVFFFLHFAQTKNDQFLTSRNFRD